MTIRKSYEPSGVARRQPLTDAAVLTVTLAVVLGAWAARPTPALVLAGALAAVHAALAGRSPAEVARRRWPFVLAVVLLGVSSGWRAHAAWRGLAPDTLGPFDGWVRLVDDPQPFGAATRLVVEAGGERFEMFARGRASQLRVGTWRGGDQVRVNGERVALAPGRATRVAWQHVVGELRVEWASDVAPGSPVAVATNRVRAAIERGAAALPDDDAALFRGLVIGDDQDQPPAMRKRFRASGLAHLTAVSGQNVSFVIAAAGPLLCRLRPAPRWAVTVVVIAWFASLTRFEPSIMRAGAMAAISTTAYALGRDRAPFRVLCLAVAALVLVDPLLVWSVGFWLSVGATAGVCAVGPWLAARLSRLGILAGPLGVTLGAQLGVALPSVLVFGRLPLVSIVANVLAVPVAGLVMLYGLPAALVAGSLPSVAGVVMFPARVGVRWVDTVAAVGARVEPSGRAVWVGWAIVVAALALIAAKNRHGHGHLPPHR